MGTLFFYFLFVATFSQDFVDDFRTLNDSLWTVENGTLICAAHRLISCAFTTPNNVYVGTIHDFDAYPGLTQSTLLTLILDNSCRDKNTYSMCCMQKLKKCTEFTTGQITSKKNFSYGRFLWLGHTSTPVTAKGSYTDNNHVMHVLSCFSLKQRKCLICTRLEISMCVSTANTHVVRLSWHIGDMGDTKRIKLDFNADTDSQFWAIDITSIGLVFYINEHLILHLTIRNMLPLTAQLIMSVSMRPQPYYTGLSTDTVLHVMHTYRMGYKSHWTIFEEAQKSGKKPLDFRSRDFWKEELHFRSSDFWNQELWVLDKGHGFSNHFAYFIVVCVIFSVYLVSIYFRKRIVKPPDSYEELSSM